MFATEQVKQWETKFQNRIAEAQKVAQEKARQVETEARKALGMLGDRAQAQIQQLLAEAKTGTRDQWVKVGGELIKLGTKMQDLAKPAEPAAPAAEAAPAPAVVEVTPPEAMN
jgi:vacuolar-type H+-ATPase subunit H